MPNVNVIDYGSLKSAVSDWLYRALDVNAGDQAAQFVALAEARIRRNQEWFVRVYSLVNGGLPLNVTGNPTALPALTEVRAMWASTGTWKHDIEILSPQTWRDLAASNMDTPGIPTKAIILNDMNLATVGAGLGAGGLASQLYMWPNPTGITDANSPFAVDFEYVADMPALSASYPASPLLVRHPDLYLYGALGEAASYYQSDERVPAWEARYQLAVKEINIERERMQFAASSKRPRLPKVF